MSTPSQAAREILLLDAPSNLGLRPPREGAVPGTAAAPAAFREAGLLQSLHAVDGGRVEPPPYSPQVDPETGIRNARAIRHYSQQLAAAIRPAIEQGYFPVVLGGDCSILIGSMLALRNVGRYGLIFLDGHTDFLQPDTSSTGGAAGMDLALVTGHGPALLTNIDGLRPLVRESDVVLLGYRDVDVPERYPARAIFDTAITRYDLEAIRRMGSAEAANAALKSLASASLNGVWLHVDVDVLDSDLMPAVDSPQAGGLAYDELISLLRPLVRSPLVAGLQVTIFDPTLDDGTCAATLSATFVEAFKETDPELLSCS
jgi:arginase